MTGMSKRWIVSLMAGVVGVVVQVQPASAEGWLRSRIRSLCETPVSPGTPATYPGTAMPPVTPQTVPQQVPDLPKIDAPKADVPPVAEPRFEPLASAALGDSSLAVGFSPAMFGDLNGRGSLPKAVSRRPLSLRSTSPSARWMR